MDTFLLWRLTGGRVHIAHISSAAAVDAVRRGKARGVRVTAEATPHHLALVDTCVGTHKSMAGFKRWAGLTDDAWLRRLREAGVAPEDIDYVFCTHLHLDHIGGVEQLFYRSYFTRRGQIRLFVPADLMPALHAKLANSPFIIMFEKVVQVASYPGRFVRSATLALPWPSVIAVPLA